MFAMRSSFNGLAARIVLSSVSAVMLVTGFGCGEMRMPSWIENGFLDPTQVGNYRVATRNEIRSAMTLLEEPEGVEGAEEPIPGDLEPNYKEQRIQPGDILRITIFELQTPGVESEKQFQVRASGDETFPSLGVVRVAGMTQRELELHLKQVLSERQILDDADVQVSVLRSEAQQYTVVGAVQQPGNFPIATPDTRLLQVIGSVGGLPTEVKTIYVFRYSESDQSNPQLPTTSPSARGRGMWSEGYTLSDLSGGSVRLAQAGPRDGELERLESTPGASETGTPLYDPNTGEWKVVPTPKGDSTARQTPVIVPVTPNRPASPPPSSTMPSSEGDDEEILGSDVRIIEIPTDALLAGDPKYNIVIRPRDLIRVPLPNVGEYFLGGNIQNPGTYRLTGRKITVKQAIVSAGGFGALAEPSRAQLIRRIGNDEEQTIQINLDAIFAGETPDFYVRPDDMINVGSTPVHLFLAVFRNAFRMSYGFGFVYDRNFADTDTFQAREAIRQRELQEAQLRGLPI